MRTQWARRGRPSTLSCGLDTPLEPNYSLEWRKNNQLIYSAYADQSGHAAPELQGRLGRAESLSLTIHSVTAEDEGVYACSVTKFSRLAPTAPLSGPPLKLVIHVPPTISSPHSGDVIYHDISGPLQLQCIASAVPSPEVNWLRGTYTCLAANVEGRVESAVEIRLPKRVHFDYLPQNRTTVEGSSAFWNCHADGYPESIQYEWRFQDKPVHATHVGLRAHTVKGELAIRDVGRADRGWYTCHASNAFGNSSASAFLDVQYVPEVLSTNRRVYTLAEGSRDSLECKADANPTVTMTNWTRNGHFVATKEKETLELENITSADAGIYTCEVYNALGRGRPFELHVIVAQPPKFIQQPPPELKVKAGSLLHLNCSGFADPMPIQYWVRNQERISGESLVIGSVGYDDDGLYECVVSNAVSAIRAETLVRVENTRPQPAKITTIECVGETSLRLEWEPGFDGGHIQQFAVHYREELLGSQATRRLIVPEARVLLSGLQRFGKYRIHVESMNVLGSANSSTLEKHVCTQLASPEDARVETQELVWQEVDGAHSYRVEMRPHYAQQQPFTPVAEVLSTHFNLASLNRISDDVDLRVVSLRPPFPPSPPSTPVTIVIREASNDAVIISALFGGLFLFIVLVMLYVLFHRSSHKLTKQKKTKPLPEHLQPQPLEHKHWANSNHFGCDTIGTQQRTRHFYEPQYTIMDEDRGSSWSGEHSGTRNHSLSLFHDGIPLKANGVTLFSYASGDLSVDCESVVGDMLRQKYIMTPEDVHSALIDELRIQRLKREYQQSHL